MAKSSIHFSVAKSNSESHNTRASKLDYILPELEGNYESWSQSSIDDKRKEVARHCKKTSGRKLQKNAEPIREAVVNLQPHHTMDDLKVLAEAIRGRFKLDCFQIHIHRDEGHYDVVDGTPRINHHAHMLFDWQDKEKGTMLKLNAKDLSEIQTLVADTLNMERGELRVNSNRERLEAVEYKAEKAKELVQLYKSDAEEAFTEYKETVEDSNKLKQELKELEQKKKTSQNELRDLESEEKKLEQTISNISEEPLNKPQKRVWSIFQKKEINSKKIGLLQQFISLNQKLKKLSVKLTELTSLTQRQKKSEIEQKTSFSQNKVERTPKPLANRDEGMSR